MTVQEVIRLAAKVPAINESFTNRFYVRGSEIIKNPNKYENVKGLDVRKIDKDRNYTIEFKDQRTINHKRRMLKCFKQKGQPGVYAYIKVMNDFLEEYNKKKEESVAVKAEITVEALEAIEAVESSS